MRGHGYAAPVEASSGSIRRDPVGAVASPINLPLFQGGRRGGLPGGVAWLSLSFMVSLHSGKSDQDAAAGSHPVDPPAAFWLHLS